MEKLKAFIKTYYIELIFSVFFILFLGFMALPFLELELVVGEYDFVVEAGKIETMTATQVVKTNIYNLIAGQAFDLEVVVNTSALDETLTTTLTNRVEFLPDVTMILGLILILIADGLFIAKTLVPIEKVKKGFCGASAALLLASLFFFVAISKYIETYDYLGGILDGADYINLGYIFTLFALFGMVVVAGTSIFKYVKFSTRDLAEIGLLVAAALVLDKIKIDIIAGAGSINLAGLPLFIIALRHGPLKGFLAASVVFGILSCLIDGYGLQTFPFDYFIAFSGYAVTGLAYQLFKKTVLVKKPEKKFDLIFMIVSFFIGACGVIVTRMIGSGLSSYIYFVEWLPEDILNAVGGNTFKAILLYNILYIGPSAAITFAGAALLAKPLQMINERYPISRLVSEETETAK